MILFNYIAYMNPSIGVPYAIKAIELKHEAKLSKMIERECSILQLMQHPNVVNLKYSFRNNDRLYLVMSYIRGI